MFILQLLTYYVIFLIIAPHSDESLKLLKELNENEVQKLNSLPELKSVWQSRRNSFVDRRRFKALFIVSQTFNNFRILLSDFLSTELTDWPLQYEASLKAHPAFETPEHWDLFRSRFMQRVS